MHNILTDPHRKMLSTAGAQHHGKAGSIQPTSPCGQHILHVHTKAQKMHLMAAISSSTASIETSLVNVSSRFHHLKLQSLCVDVSAVSQQQY